MDQMNDISRIQFSCEPLHLVLYEAGEAQQWDRELTRALPSLLTGKICVPALAVIADISEYYLYIKINWT